MDPELVENVHVAVNDKDGGPNEQREWQVEEYLFLERSIERQGRWQDQEQRRGDLRTQLV